VGVAVSGGADSVALLRLLLELRDELGVLVSGVHFHHQIRGSEADGDQAFVRDLAARHGLELHCGAADAPQYARLHRRSLETAARELRYRFFRHLLEQNTVDKIATGHTRDDQAETVLMRLMRGAGTRGLAGIYPLLPIAGNEPWPHPIPPSGAKAVPQRGAGAPEPHSSEPRSGSPGAPESRAIIRPLLAVRHREIEAWLQPLGQSWREDSSNRDLRHTRNRVRHELLPLLEREYNPGIVQVLAEAAEVARAEEAYWQRQIADLEGVPASPESIAGSQESSSISLDSLARLPLALQRRRLRAWAARAGLHLDFEHVEALRHLAIAADRLEKQSKLPGGWRARRVAGELRLESPAEGPKQEINGYCYRLPVPGEVAVNEIGSLFRALLLPAKQSGYNRARFAGSDSGMELVVRNWRPGDRFWPAHSKSPKKVKELLQRLGSARPLAIAERKLWPVVACGQTLIWMRGCGRSCSPEEEPPAVVIEELALSPVQFQGCG